MWTLKIPASSPNLYKLVSYRWRTSSISSTRNSRDFSNLLGDVSTLGCPYFFLGTHNLLLSADWLQYCSLSSAITSHSACLCSQQPLTWNPIYARVPISFQSQAGKKHDLWAAPKKPECWTCIQLFSSPLKIENSSWEFSSNSAMLCWQMSLGKLKVVNNFPAHSIVAVRGFVLTWDTEKS